MSVGQMLCGVVITATLSEVSFTATAVLSGCLQCLSYLLLLPSIRLIGVGPSVALSSFTSHALQWSTIALCGLYHCLQVDTDGTVHTPALLLCLLLLAAACTCLLTLASRQLTWPLPLLQSPLRQRQERRQHAARVLYSPTASPRSPKSDDSPSLERLSPPMSPTTPTSPDSSDELLARDPLPAGRLRLSRPRSLPQLAYHTFHLQMQDKADLLTTKATRTLLPHTDSPGTRPRWLPALEDAHTDILPPLSQAEPVSPASCGGEPGLELREWLPSSPHAQLAVAAACCAGGGVMDGVCLLPIYADAPYGLQRFTYMGPSMLGRSVGLLLPLIFLYAITHWTLLRPPPASLATQAKEVTVATVLPLSLLSSWPESTTAPLLPSATTSSSSSTLSPCLHALLSFLLSSFPALLCGCASSLSFFLLHHVLPLNFAAVPWYFFTFPNDHYMPLTVFVPLAATAPFAHAAYRALAHRTATTHPSPTRSGGVLSAVVLWTVGLLLASIGQYMAVSNVLQRVV